MRTDTEASSEALDRACTYIGAIAAASDEDGLRILIDTAITNDVRVRTLAAAILDVATGHAPLGRCNTPAHRAAATPILRLSSTVPR